MKKLIVASILALVTGLASAQTFFPNFPTYPSSVSNALQKTTFTLEEEFRQDGDQNKFFYEHTDFQLKYTLADWADVFASYRLVFQDKTSWQHQDMVIPGFNLRVPAQYLPANFGALSLRSREEITLTTSGNKANYQLTEFLKYNTPWKFTRYQINPFIGDEAFFDTDYGMNFDRNRIYGGVDYVITKYLKGSVFYYYQQDKAAKTSSWAAHNIFVAQIKLSF